MLQLCRRRERVTLKRCPLGQETLDPLVPDVFQPFTEARSTEKSCGRAKCRGRTGVGCYGNSRYGMRHTYCPGCCSGCEESSCEASHKAQDPEDYLGARTRLLFELAPRLVHSYVTRSF